MSLETDFIREQVDKLSLKIDKLSDEISKLRDNHIHQLDLSVERIETTLKIVWKAVVFGAGVPAIISSVLSVINLTMK